VSVEGYVSKRVTFCGGRTRRNLRACRVGLAGGEAGRFPFAVSDASADAASRAPTNAGEGGSGFPSEVYRAPPGDLKLSLSGQCSLAYLVSRRPVRVAKQSELAGSRVTVAEGSA
jgi:hypothetical protein